MPETAPHRIALQMVGHHPRVQIQIEGIDRPLSFVVDTAAGATVIDAALAEATGMFDAPAGNVQFEVQGAGGSAGTVPITGSRRLSAGNFRWTAQMLAMDLSKIAKPGITPVDGILGNDLMSRFDLRFDVAAGELLLAQPGSLPRSGCLDNALPERADNLQRFAFVDAQMQDGAYRSPVMMVVDTGAAQTVLNVAAARALGVGEDDPRARRLDAGTGGISKHRIETWIYTLPSLEISDWKLDAFQVRISPLPVFAQLGLVEQPALILGIDALRQGRIDVLADAAAVCLGPEGSGEPDTGSTASRTHASGMLPAQ